MRRSGLYMVTPAMLMFAQSLEAADTGHGKTLKQQHCMSCHDDGVYTRSDRRVTTLEGLRKQVKRCELTLELQWFDDDVNAVTGHLNETFYKF